MITQEECNVIVVKKKQGKKQYLNIIMTLLIILLMKIAFSGIVWHEVLGLGLFILFLMHHIYNFRYTLQVLKKFFSNKVKLIIKIGLVLDALLFLVISGLVFTSLNISNLLFQFRGLDAFWPELSSIHIGLANLALILIALHIGLHWSVAMYHIKRFLKISKSSLFKKWSLRLLVVVIALFGVYSFNDLAISKKISESAKNLFILSGKLLVDDDEFSFYYPNPIKVGALSFQIAEQEDEEDEEDEEDQEDEEDEEDTPDGVTSSSPTNPNQPVDGVTSSSPTKPNQPVDGVTSSSPINPNQNIDGVTSSSPTNPNQNVDGVTSSSPTEQNIDGITSSTTKNVLSQTKYQQYDEKSDYVLMFSEYFSVISLFVTISYYTQKLILKLSQLR